MEYSFFLSFFSLPPSIHSLILFEKKKENKRRERDRGRERKRFFPYLEVKNRIIEDLEVWNCFQRNLINRKKVTSVKVEVKTSTLNIHFCICLFLLLVLSFAKNISIRRAISFGNLEELDIIWQTQIKYIVKSYLLFWMILKY